MLSDIEIQVLHELRLGSLQAGAAFDKTARALFPNLGSYDANRARNLDLRTVGRSRLRRRT